MTDNPFTETMDEQEAEQEATGERGDRDAFDVDQYYDALNTGLKDKTIGFSTTEEMHAFFHELQGDDEVEIDVHQSLRDHIEKLAHRHPEVFERAMRKMEIDREY